MRATLCEKCSETLQIHNWSGETRCGVCSFLETNGRRKLRPFDEVVESIASSGAWEVAEKIRLGLEQAMDVKWEPVTSMFPFVSMKNVDFFDEGAMPMVVTVMKVGGYQTSCMLSEDDGPFTAIRAEFKGMHPGWLREQEPQLKGWGKGSFIEGFSSVRCGHEGVADKVEEVSGSLLQQLVKDIRNRLYWFPKEEVPEFTESFTKLMG